MDPQLPRSRWQLKRLARSRATGASTLAVLAHHAEAHVRARVGSNPNVPLPALAALTHDVDSEVREHANRNPAMQALRNATNGVTQIPTEKMYGVTGQFADVFGGPVRYVLTGPNRPSLTAAQALGALVLDGGAEVIRDLHDGAASAEPAAIAVLAHSQSTKVRSKLVELSRTTSWGPDGKTLDFLISIDPDLRQRIARHARADTKALLALSNSYPRDVAENPNASARVLSHLAGHGEMQVRRYVARNRNTDAGTLDRLARDATLNVREEVAENPNAPTSALDVLASIPYMNVPGQRLTEGARVVHIIKIAVSTHPNTSTATLRALADDGFQQYVAKNPNTPGDLLARMAADFLRRRPTIVGEPEEYDQQQELFAAIRRNPNTPAKTRADVGV